MPKPEPEPADWTCRFFREGDEQGMLDVLLATFDRWPSAELSVSPMDHLRWKLRNSDVAWRSHAVVEQRGRIVACSISIVQWIKLGDRVLKTIHSVDAAVLPELQGLGVGRALRRFNGKARPDSFDVYFGVESGHPSMPHLRKQDWDGVRIVRPGEVVVADGPFARPTNGHAWTLREVERFDERVDAFRIAAAEPFQRITIRTKDELNWRYCDPRSGPFRVVLAEEGERLVGHAVYRMSRGRGHIAELLALPGRLDVVATLVKRALGDLQTGSASEVECWSTPAHPYRELLRDAGFTRVRRQLGIVHKSVRAPDEWLACLEDDDALMHVMAGDTDLV